VSDIDEKLNWVKQVVEKTNRSVEEYNKEAEAREALVGERLKKHTVEEEGKVEEIKDVMRKRFRTV
jgi:hypothetical protein